MVEVDYENAKSRLLYIVALSGTFDGAIEKWRLDRVNTALMITVL